MIIELSGATKFLLFPEPCLFHFLPGSWELCSVLQDKMI